MLLRLSLTFLFFLLFFSAYTQIEDSIQRPYWNIRWPNPETAQKHQIRQITIWKHVLSDSGTTVDSVMERQQFYNKAGKGVFTLKYDKKKVKIFDANYSYFQIDAADVEQYQSSRVEVFLLRLDGEIPELKEVAKDQVVADSAMIFARQQGNFLVATKMFTSIFGESERPCHPGREQRPEKLKFNKRGKLIERRHGRDHYFEYYYNDRNQVVRYTETDKRKTCWSELPKGQFKIEEIRNRKRFRKYRIWEDKAKIDDAYKKKLERADKYMQRLQKRLLTRKARQNVINTTLAKYDEEGHLLHITKNNKVNEHFFYNDKGQLIQVNDGSYNGLYTYYPNGVLYKYTRRYGTDCSRNCKTETRTYTYYK